MAGPNDWRGAQTKEALRTTSCTSVLATMTRTLMPKVHYTRLPVTPKTGKLQICCELATEKLL